MVTDAQVRSAMKHMKQGMPFRKAALKANLDPRTLRKYLNLGKLPSACRVPRAWRTREDPFDPDDMTWALGMIANAPELDAKTIFDNLCERRPERYQDGQLRTFQRRIERWRATEGPPQEVWFGQEHRPGEAVQTDFTWVTELEVTIQGVPAPGMLCHSVLPYSNVESATVCHSESMLAIRAGVQRAVFDWGHVPTFHQMDNSTAATHRVGIPSGGDRAFNQDYVELMDHLGMKPRSIAIGASEQNGDIESSNGGLKHSLKQHLLLRGHTDFESTQAWQAFVDGVVQKRNRRRQARFLEDLAAMTPLAVAPAPTWTERDVIVSSGSIVNLMGKPYTVPSRLIGKRVRARLYENRVEIWFGGERHLDTERRIGREPPAIDYHHVIWSLVRKPAAFARYRYRDAMFPTVTFRLAFDALEGSLGASTRTDLEYVRILHLAASTLEADVDTALRLLLAEHRVPRLEDVRSLVAPVARTCPEVGIGTPDLARYDLLLVGGDA